MSSAQDDHSITFRFVSEIIGRRATNSSGEVLGRIVDLVATGGEMYPQVWGVLVDVRGEGQRVAALPAAALHAGLAGRSLCIDPLTLRELRSGPKDFSIRELLMDKQIVDVQGAKVVRVNDVHLLVTDRARIVHVDVGFSGLLRRLGVEHAARRVWTLAGRTLHDELISWKFVQPLGEKREAGGPIRLQVEHAKIAELHPAELAEILEDLDRYERAAILESIGPEAAADALEEAEDEVQAAVISQLAPEVAADILEEMDPGEAADILTNLPEDQSEIIIAQVDEEERAQLEKLIEYAEKTAAALMTPEFVAVAPDATVGEALDEVRRLAAEIEGIYYVYVRDEQERLVGVTALRALLIADASTRVADVMETRIVSVQPESEPGQVAQLFQKYKFLACPVLDRERKMLGIILFKHAFDDLLPEFEREGG